MPSRKRTNRQAPAFAKATAGKPATKSDVQRLRQDFVKLRQDTKSDAKRLRQDFGQLRAETKEDSARLRQEMQNLKDFIKQENEETRRHFDVVAENIHLDVAGVNSDEISLIKDQQLPDHEARIQTVETKLGLPAGPRHRAT